MPIEITDGDHGGAFEPGRHEQRKQDDARANSPAGERPPAERGRRQSAVGEG